MKIPLTGLRCSRLLEWWAVVERAGRRIGWWALSGQMLAVLWRAATSGQVMTRQQFRHRIRTCSRCPVYDRLLRRCGPSDTSPIGCHCWVPLLAIMPGDPYDADPEIPGSRSGCYADVVFPEENCGWSSA